MMCGLILRPILDLCLYTSSHTCTSLTKCVSFEVLMLVTMKTAVTLLWSIGTFLLNCGLSHVRREQTFNWACWGNIVINYLPRISYRTWLKFGFFHGIGLGKTCQPVATTIIWHNPVGHCFLGCFVKSWVCCTLTHCVLKLQISIVTADALMSARPEIDLMCCVLPKGHTFKCNGQELYTGLQFSWQYSNKCLYLEYCFG
jgi:hypothetical protein